VDYAFKSAEVSLKRVIVTPDSASCAFLAALKPNPVLNCVVDGLTPQFFPSARAAGAGLELLKFQWTAEALSHGHDVLYTDADLIFRGVPSPHGASGAAVAASNWRGDIAAAVDPMRFFRSARDNKGPGVPDLQMMSDHSPNLEMMRDRCDDRLMAGTFEFLSRSSTYQSWREATYERMYRPTYVQQLDGVVVSVDHAGLVCARGELWAPGAVGGCLSMALWFARPTPGVAELFRESLGALRDLHAASRTAEGPPLGLDQVVFNRAVIAALTRFKLVVLDVRQAGNDVEQNCARQVLGGAPPPPLATHFRGPNKDNYMKLAGPDIWRVPVDAPQYP
jgi:hypothetical protein